MALRIYGNRQLKTLPGRDTRPTPARVREAVFNIWQPIAGCRWLDLCAGSGSMGAEALCRGAARAVAIELSPRACQIVKQNWQQVATSEQPFRVLRGDVGKRLKSLSGEQFDRIYFDPPYGSDLYQPVLEAIAAVRLLAPGGELIAEHDPKREMAEIPGLAIVRRKVYGSTALTFYSGSRGDGCDRPAGN